MNSFLVADSGSTKTDWTLVSEHGGIHARWQSSGLNPFYQTADHIQEVMVREVFPQVDEQPVAIYFYGAGCADIATGRPVQEALKTAYPDARIEVASDLLGAARGLCQRESGIACILGTGSNNCLYDGAGIVSNIGSLGFWMGDEGSGGYLGKQLVIAYLHEELPSSLQEAFAVEYPHLNRLFVLEQAYRKPFPNRFFASFAIFISRHIREPYLHAMVREAFDLFLAKYVIKHKGATSCRVSFTGSVAWHFQDILKTELDERGLLCGTIERSPVPGLIRYHLEQDGLSIH